MDLSSLLRENRFVGCWVLIPNTPEPILAKQSNEASL